jgi:hypothetical protein
MFRSFVRFAKASLAAIFIAATPALSAIEAVAHARSADQPHHPNRSHFENEGASSHSDHCFAGRTFGSDRFVLAVGAPKTSLAADLVVEVGDTPTIVGLQALGPHRSRAPPALRG